MTRTKSFGSSKREAHDSSLFYQRSLFDLMRFADEQPVYPAAIAPLPEKDWLDRIFCQSSEHMPLPAECVSLAFTSPPYNVGKDYEEDISMPAYLEMIEQVGREVYRVLRRGGRYVINISNLGRKPYIPLHVLYYQIHIKVGFLPMGEIIWQKAKGSNSSCAWGSWQSAKAPRLRDIHEYLLVFAKGSFSRPDSGESDIGREEFMESTLSVWQIPSESARRVGHPAPFPVQLASRVIQLYSYVGDVVLDPFVGSGTTCVAAKQTGRHYVGFDVSPEYCELANNRLAELDLPIRDDGSDNMQ